MDLKCVCYDYEAAVLLYCLKDLAAVNVSSSKFNGHGAVGDGESFGGGLISCI